MSYDNWLDRWAPLIKESGRTALDVGCGPGYDTEVLTSWGFAVVASDVSSEAINCSKQRNPRVKHVEADARTLEPFADQTFDVVVASLSLHYFDRPESDGAFRSVNRVLREGGLFAFRVNAWDDHEFGAPRVFRQWTLTSYDGKKKQFFKEEMLCQLLRGRFEILAIEKMKTVRYVKPKSLFEVFARKVGDGI